MLELQVAGNTEATPTSRIVRLDLAGLPFTYKAGQSAALAAVPDDDFTPYSFASSPEETARLGVLEFLVKVDGSSRFGARVSSLAPGDRVILRGPIGSFTFPDHPSQRSFLFIAGGTGIAPIRSMIRHAVDAGVSGRLRLLYSARSSQEFAYLSELQQLARKGVLDLELTLTGEAMDWSHTRGRIDASLLGRVVGYPKQTLVFICGPPAMLTEVSQALEEGGVPPGSIRTESW